MKAFIQNHKFILSACGIGLAGLLIGSALHQPTQPRPAAEKYGPPVPHTNIETETDPMTDGKQHLLLIESTDTSANAIGNPETSILVVRCDAGKKPDVYIAIASYIGIYDSPAVQTRWDGGQAKAESWTTSNTGTAILSGAPQSMLNKAKGSNKLVVSWQPYGHIRQAATFDLKQHQNDLVIMESLCNA